MSDKKFTLKTSWTPKGDQPKAIQELTKNFQQGQSHQTLLGVTGSGKTFVMANVISALQMPTLVMAHNKTLAAQLYLEFKNFFPDNAVEYFISYYDFYQPEAYLPTRDVYIEKEASINEQIEQFRMATTSALISRRDVIVVASISCIYNLGDPKDYESMVLCLEKKQKKDRNELLLKLVSMQYNRNDYELSRGNFRVRGDVIELWPSYQENIIRCELFGDTIERISTCQAITGKIIHDFEHLTIYPAKHHVMPKEKVDKALSSIELELEKRLAELKKQEKILEAERLKTRTMYDLEMLKEIGYCAGMENYSLHFSDRKNGERPPCLFDYFTKPYLVIVDESHISIPQIKGMHLGDKARKNTLVEYGFRLPSALDNRPLQFKEWEKIVDKVLFVSATPNEYEIKKANGSVIELLVRPTGLLDPEIEVYPAENQIEHLFALLQEKVAKKERTLITTLTKKLAEQITDFLQEKNMRVAYLHCDIDTFERSQILTDLRKGVYDALVGINLLREGLDLPEVSTVAILDADREGFLRSETSLIQTMGRAARHEKAKVIFYADKITESMKRAIQETKRRRQIQWEYNQQHNIQPQSIQKDILSDINFLQEGVSPYNEKILKTKKNKQEKNNKKQRKNIQTLEQEVLEAEELEKEMKEAAKNLEFEKAAYLRDQLLSLKKKLKK